MHLLFSFYAKAQLCSGTLGAPIFVENFGSGTALYGPALPAGVTGYPYVTGNPPNGSYVISGTSDPSGATSFAGDYIICPTDHTGNLNGYMMVINSDYAASEVYRRHVTGLCQNTTYVFSAYLSNNDDPSVLTVVCVGSYIYANVKFQTEYPVGTVQGFISTGNLPLSSNHTTLNWQQYGFVFTTAPGQTSVDVVMKNNAPGGCGNDYTVDDISLSPCGPGMALSIIPNKSLFCSGEPIVLQATFTSGNYTNPQFQWQFSNNNGATWTDIAGATSLTYSINSVVASQGGMYQLVDAENGNINLPSCSIIAGPLSFSVAPQVSMNTGFINAACSTTQGDTLIASGASTYTWSTGVNTNSVVVNPSSTTSYTVVGTTGTCTSQAVSTVSITPSSTVSISGNDSICAGDNISLQANGATNYSWNTGATTQVVNVIPITNTTYTVIGSIGTCTSMAVATVIVKPNPIPVITGNTTLCQGQSTLLTATNGNTYSWSTGSTIPNINISPSVNTTYTVVNTTGTCTNQAIATVSVTPNPTVSVSGDSAICLGSQANLQANGATNYIWNTGATTASVYLNPIANATYTVLGSIGTCTNVAIATVSVNPTPIVSVTGNTVVCSGQATSLTAVGATSYTWSTGATIPMVNLTPTVTTTYSVVGVKGSCVDIVTVTVTTSTLFLTGSSVICQGKNTTLTAHGSNTYLWNTGATTPSIVLSPTVTTIYSVIGTTGTCIMQTFDTVFVSSIPYVSIIGDTIICSGQTTVLTASGAGSYLWSTGVATPNITLSPKTTTTYSVVGTTGTCTYQTVEIVHVYPTPNAAYEINPNPITIISPLANFTNQSINYTQWLWDFGDGASKDSINKNPSHYYNTENISSFQTSLMLTNQYGCKDEAYITLVVKPEFSFYIPNTFTPNGDNSNELFKGVGTGIERYEIQIFNRWGTCIFSSNNIDAGWDGKVKNSSEVVQQDVYVWKVEIQDISNNNHRFYGTVNLIK